MLKAHKIRLNPTPEQEQYFYRAAGVARFAYNWALENYKAIKANDQKADWNQIKKDFRAEIDSEFPFVREVTKCSPEQGIADLRQSISTYYKTKKSHPRSKIRFPKYRARSKKVGGFGLANDKFSVDGHAVRVPRLGNVNMAESLRFTGKIMGGRIKEQHGKWFLVVTVEVEVVRVERKPNSVGIDFGLTTFAMLSNADTSETQAFLRKSAHRLKSVQRGLSRKNKGSANRYKAKMQVARTHERITNQRDDHSHKFTDKVTKDFSIVCVEDLCLRGLVRTNGKSFSDAAIGTTIKQLEYKAVERSGLVQKVGRFFASTKRCHPCGYINNALTLKDRVWTCPQCGTVHNRDFNASVNIELEGVDLLVGSGYIDVTTVELTAAASRVKDLWL